MMRPPAPPHRGAATLQDTLMHRLMLSTQGSPNGHGRVERSREDLTFMGRNFLPSTFQNPQISSEVLDLWSNASGADSFSSTINGSPYGYVPAAAAVYPNILNLPHLPPAYLRCPECGIVKMNSEEMEVHIKVEHLQWNPFQCTICSAERAADFQLREHVHSVHRKNIDKFIYVDNATAKRSFQIMMDRCLMNARCPPMVSTSQSSAVTQSAAPQHFHAPSPLSSMRERLVNHASDLKLQDGRLAVNSSTPHEQSGECTLRNINTLSGTKELVISQQQHTKSVHPAVGGGTAVGATATVISRKRSSSNDNSLSWNTNTDAVLSAIRVATHENGEKEVTMNEESGVEDGEEEDDEDFSSTVPGGSRTNARNAADATTDQPSTEQSDEAILSAASDGTQDTTEILGNVAAIFSADDVDLARKRRNRTGNGERPKASASSLAKKRVLGECGRCKKPVTAGARQMHMFFHLGKDCQIYRFRCKFPGCQVEHYRKDQMENHQSKAHGKIDPMLIEDRTAELFSTCQELSMQLLGTTGNMPGPTAARAQMAYEAYLAAQAMNPKRQKKLAERALAVAAVDARRVSARRDVNRQEQTPSSVPTTSKLASPSEQNDEQQMLECRLCRKMLFSRIRGFHILWHMARDLGINRYVCKYCEFGHDRTQAVINHGKKEHNTEDCVEDRIEEYSDEVKSMSESCFGLQANFTQDSRRKRKHDDELENEEVMIIESKTSTTDEAISSTGCSVDEREMNIASTSNGTEPLHFPPRPKSEPRPHLSASSSTSSYRDRMRKARNRRFGIRKPPSKLKRKEMAKLREISMRLGGAQYFKKRLNEAAHCQKCGMLTTSRLSDHAYKHLNVQLFLCPQCNIGNQSRDLVVKHIRDVHNSQEHPIDERLKYRMEIKEIIRECYPAYFVDAPVPTAADIEKLKKSLATEKRFDAPVFGTADDDHPKSCGEQQEQEGVGEAEDGDSDDEQMRDDGIYMEQDSQPFAEEAVEALDENEICEADEAQQRFAMENDEQFVDRNTNSIGDRVTNGHKVEEYEGAISEHSICSGLMKNQSVSKNSRDFVKKERTQSDFDEVIDGDDAVEINSEEDEEEEAEM